MKSICNETLLRKGGIKKKKRFLSIALWELYIGVEMMPMANHVISLLIEHQWLVKKITLLQNKKKMCYILFHKKEGNLYWPEVIVKEDWHMGNGHFENWIDLNRVIYSHPIFSLCCFHHLSFTCFSLFDFPVFHIFLFFSFPLHLLLQSFYSLRCLTNKALKLNDITCLPSHSHKVS